MCAHTTASHALLTLSKHKADACSPLCPCACRYCAIELMHTCVWVPFALLMPALVSASRRPRLCCMMLVPPTRLNDCPLGLSVYLAHDLQGAAAPPP